MATILNSALFSGDADLEKYILKTTNWTGYDNDFKSKRTYKFTKNYSVVIVVACCGIREGINDNPFLDVSYSGSGTKSTDASFKGQYFWNATGGYRQYTIKNVKANETITVNNDGYSAFVSLIMIE